MLNTDGVPTKEEICSAQPSAERRARGPVVWIECFQEIPCDPCHDACPAGAIAPFEDINDLPAIDHDGCTGCGLCIAACPGLAIFVIDETYSETEAVLRMPYEFTPVPGVDEEVTLLNRSGEEVGTGRILRVQKPAAFDRTAVVWVVIPKDRVADVRAFRRWEPKS